MHERDVRLQDIKLVAVTKTVGIEKTNEVIEAGIIDLGENRNEGFLQKYEHFGSKVNWHFIGSLQTRKVKEIINEIDYLHSLDRLSLAKEIQKRANKKVKCFIQVKTSSEESKQGLAIDETIPFIQSLQELDKIEVVGLMTMAPFTEEGKKLDAVLRSYVCYKQRCRSWNYCMRHVKNYQWECLMITRLQLKKALHIFVWGRF